MSIKKLGMAKRNPNIKPKSELKIAHLRYVLKYFLNCVVIITSKFHTIKYIGVHIPKPYKTICKKQNTIVMVIVPLNLRFKEKRISRKVTNSTLGKKASISFETTSKHAQIAYNVIFFTLFIKIMNHS